MYATILKGRVPQQNGHSGHCKYTVPLCICALGVTLAFKMRFWNIGGEGS